jgi:hypothetical protein
MFSEVSRAGSFQLPSHPNRITPDKCARLPEST